MYRLELSKERAEDIVRQIRDLASGSHVRFDIPCSYFPDWYDRLRGRFFKWWGVDLGYCPGNGMAELIVDTNKGASIRIWNRGPMSMPSLDVDFKSLGQLERCLLYEATSERKARWVDKQEAKKRRKERKKWQSFIGN